MACWRSPSRDEFDRMSTGIFPAARGTMDSSILHLTAAASGHNIRVIGFTKLAPSRAGASAYARFARALRNAPMMVCVADASGRVIFVNRKWLSFTGRRLRDELGDGWAASL